MSEKVLFRNKFASSHHHYRELLISLQHESCDKFLVQVVGICRCHCSTLKKILANPEVSMMAQLLALLQLCPGHRFPVHKVNIF